jgi:endonuclease YncB( thermonuclease family)
MNRRALIAGAAACMGSASAGPTVDGANFTLASRAFRLADIIAPHEGDPYAEDARRELYAVMALGFAKLADAAPLDRWGRRVVRPVSAALGGASAQDILVAAGAARVRPETDDVEALRRLFAAEQVARRTQRGLWALRAYAARDASEARSAIGGFHLVEGIVREAFVGRGRVYLNFGEDYRTDFTITAASRDAKRWAKSSPDLAALAGTRVRVRGYCAWINGPSIEIDHPLQIEIVAPATAGGEISAAARGLNAAQTIQATASPR